MQIQIAGKVYNELVSSLVSLFCPLAGLHYISWNTSWLQFYHTSEPHLSFTSSLSNLIRTLSKNGPPKACTISCHAYLIWKFRSIYLCASPCNILCNNAIKIMALCLYMSISRGLVTFLEAQFASLSLILI